MNWILDPRAFNVLIILLFIAAAIRWAFAGNWPQAGYWASAAVLNVFVTVGVK
jgi:hypothetical protein